LLYLSYRGWLNHVKDPENKKTCYKIQDGFRDKEDGQKITTELVNDYMSAVFSKLLFSRVRRDYAKCENREKDCKKCEVIRSECYGNKESYRCPKCPWRNRQIADK
jgi:tRNA(Ile2) C34 agmatinyltransferase TiaS